MNRRTFLKALGLTAVVAHPVAKAFVIPSEVVDSVSPKKGNNFDSNFIKKLEKQFLKAFEKERVLQKFTRINHLQGDDMVTIRRPADYRSAYTA